MKQKLKFFITKLQLSMRTIGWVLTQWRYALLATAFAILFFELIYWLFNLSVLTTILTSGNVTPLEKLEVLASPVQAIASAEGMTTALLILILAIIQGINLAVLTYTIKHQPKVDQKLVGGSTVVTFLAVLGLGCPACGTSLITPIVAVFVSGSAVAVSEKIAAIVTPIALLVALYGMYVVGLRAATIRAQQVYKQDGELLSAED